MCGPLAAANDQKLSLHCLPPGTTVCEVAKSVYPVHDYYAEKPYNKFTETPSTEIQGR
jgi:hypothetical protein